MLTDKEKKEYKSIKERLKKSTKYVLFIDKNDIQFLINIIERNLKNKK